LSDLAVNYGGCEYWDQTGSLMNGTVRPPGIEPKILIAFLIAFFPVVISTVVIRRPMYEANRWMVASLFEAFELAKSKGRERLGNTGPLAVGLPWIPADLEELDEVFGEDDPWAYGVEPNRKVLEAMIQYSFEQGLSEKVVGIEELFAEESFVPPTIGASA